MSFSKTVVCIASVCLVGVTAGLAQGGPLSVTDNLLVWLKADEGVAADGDGYVSVWADQGTSVGGSNNATQGTQTKQPRLIQNASPFGDRPVLRFDGTDDYLQIGANSTFDTNNLSWFAVYKPASKDYGIVMSSHYDYTSPGETNCANNLWAMTPASTYSVHIRDSEGTIRGVSSGSVDTSKFVIHDAVWDGDVGSDPTQGTLYAYCKKYGDTSWTGGSPVTDVDADPSGHTYTRIGSYVYLNYYDFQGDIAEILIYNTTLGDTDRQLVQQYLDDKWFSLNPIPEPSTLVLLAAGGLLLLLVVARRRR